MCNNCLLLPLLLISKIILEVTAVHEKRDVLLTGFEFPLRDFPR